MSALPRLPGVPSVWVRWLICICWSLLLTVTSVIAQQAVPALSGHVIDTTNTLSAQQMQQMESRLTAFEHSAGAQIVLLLVPTTQPEDIASYANRVSNSWKIGRKDIGDGLLLLVAKNDHKVRIEVAKALEGAIPDLAARRIIDQSITPHFKQDDFAGGLDAAVVQIIARISGESLPAPAAAPRNFKAGFEWTDLAIFAFFAVPILGAVARRVLGTNLGAVATGGAIGAVAMVLTSSFVIAGLAALGALFFTLVSSVAGSAIGSGWSSGRHGGWGAGGTGFGSGSGSGGSSGGGFSSGGGGDFGGGGASGDW
jgi:uncharacterized protein